MHLTRKNFLIGSMATMALGARQMFAAAPGTVMGTPRLKVGVLSDVHLFVEDLNRQKVLVKALEWFRDQGADAIVMAGDLADFGLVEELQGVGDAWKTVFPENKAPDGRTVEKVFALGNHDYHGYTYSNYGSTYHKKTAATVDYATWCRDNILRTDIPGWWKKIFNEDYSIFFKKEIKGFTFLGQHWDDGTDMKGGYRQCPFGAGLKDFLAANGAKMDPSRPFFYVQHPHLKDTCQGWWAWGHDTGVTTKALSAFPQALALSGHSHYSLTDERTVWQGAFTAIGTSSLHYTGYCYNYRENAHPNRYGKKETRPHEMPNIQTRDGKQGMLLTICDDHIRIERREFMWNQSLGDDWILPIGKGAAKPYEFAKRIPQRVAPEFAADATAKVELIESKPGKDGKKAKPTKLKVLFSSAVARSTCRVFEYEIRAVAVADDVEIPVATRRVLATDFHLPLSQAKNDNACIFALAALPKKVRIRFDIRPCECFGKKGAPISTPLFTTPA